MSQRNTVSEREPSLALSISTFVAIIAIIGYAAIVLGTDLHMALVTSAIFAAIIGKTVIKIQWGEIQANIISTLGDALEAILIMMTVGVLVGTWILAGTVPGLIYYGLYILKPAIFPVSTMLICSIVALATGSSWQASATAGIALMGVGNGLGIPAPLTAGMVVSGGYFGDKMSPLSDSTNLAPAVSGSKLFDHIHAMVWSTTPAYVIALVIAVFLGLKFTGGNMDYDRISAIQSILAAEFPISPLCLIPPLIIILTAILKLPALPGMFAGIGIAVVISFFHGYAVADIWEVAQNGYVATTSQAIANAPDNTTLITLLKDNNLLIDPSIAKEVSSLLSGLVTRGGLQSMMWLISMMMLALSMGAILECCGFLRVILMGLIKNAKRAGDLITAAVLAAFLSNFFLGDQAMSAVIPGRMFKSIYEKSGLAPRMLSRSLEDGGTVTSPLIPWTTCGAYQAEVLGVATLSFLPYAVFNLIMPFVSIAITYLGIGIYWRDPQTGEDRVEKRTLITPIN